MRELFRQNREAVAGLDVDIVINARRGSAEAPWGELTADYRACLDRLCVRLTGG
jgi:hypothetical protein